MWSETKGDREPAEPAAAREQGACDAESGIKLGRRITFGVAAQVWSKSNCGGEASPKNLTAITCATVTLAIIVAVILGVIAVVMMMMMIVVVVVVPEYVTEYVPEYIVMIVVVVTEYVTEYVAVVAVVTEYVVMIVVVVPEYVPVCNIKKRRWWLGVGGWEHLHS